MFGLFKKKSEREKLEKQYKSLIAESHRLSTSNRAESDRKAAQAEEVARKIEALDS